MEVAMALKVQIWSSDMARKAMRDVCFKLLSMTERYCQGKVNEYCRESGFTLVIQTSLWSDGDSMVLTLRLRPTDDTLLRLAQALEEEAMKDKMMLQSEPLT